MHDGVFTSEHGEMTLTLGDVGGMHEGAATLGIRPEDLRPE